MKSVRGQSETVGIVLLLGIVVASVSVAGGIVLSSDRTDSDTTLATVEINITESDVTVTHTGGDPIDGDALDIVVRSGSSTKRAQSAATGQFTVSDTVTVSHSLTGVVDVLVVDRETNTVLGRERRTFGAAGTPTASAPTAAFTYSPDTPVGGDEIAFDGADSSDPDGGSIRTYQWDFDGDGTTDATGATATYSFEDPGAYPVTLTVTDDEGATGSATTTVTVGPDGSMFVTPDSGRTSLTVDGLGLVGREASEAVIDFDEYSLSSYGGNQDDFDTAAIRDGGRTLYLANSTWKRIEYPYEMTGDTVVAFDFRSETEGEIHGLGLEENNDQSRERIYRVYGTQTWGLSGYDYGGAGWERFRVAAGADYDITAQYLAFVMDHDSGAQNGQSEFRDVMVYDDSTDSYSYEWDFDGDGAVDATGQQPSHTYDSAGTYTVSLTITGSGGASTTLTETVTVESSSAPRASFTPPADPRIGAEATFDGSDSSDPDGGSIQRYAWDFDGDGTTDATGATATYSFEESGEKQVSLTVTDDEGQTETTTQTVLVDPEVVYATNAGGGPVTASDGVEYSSDEGCEEPDGGSNTYTETGVDVTGTQNDALYNTECWAPGSEDLTYSVDVPDGEYRVTLKFAEIYFSQADQRIFDVAVETVPVENNVDLYVAAGGEFTAYDITTTVEVTDGTLNVDLLDETENPKLGAMLVERVGPSG